jgi:hypothetical protein
MPNIPDFLPLTTSQRTSAAPPVGQLVLDTNTNQLYRGDGSTLGGQFVGGSSSPAISAYRRNGNMQLIATPRSVSSFARIGNFAVSNGVLHSRLNCIPTKSASQIVLVYFTGQMSPATAEALPAALYRIQAAVEIANTGNITDETTARIPVTFGGKSWGKPDLGGWLYSDPIPYQAVAGTPFFVRTAIAASGSSVPIPYNASVLGGTGAGNFQNGDGYVTGNNHVLVGTSTFAVQQSAHGPVAVLGYVDTPGSSLAFLGDSIGNGGSDGGYGLGTAGWMCRICDQLFTRLPSYPYTPSYTGVHTCTPGGTLADLATFGNNANRLRLASLASTVVCEMGINDIGVSTLGQMQTNITTLANYFTALGCQFIACTLTPYTSSTDNWKTIANQTVHSSGGETVRTGYNTWLANGTFAAQCNTPAMVSVFDVSGAIEVNSSGTTVRNGGYWPPAASSGYPTGTLTASSGSTVTDNTKSWTQDQYKGYVVSMTSGAAANIGSCIAGNTTAGAMQCFSTFSVQPSIGDSYAILDTYTVDGLHPSSIAHAKIAQAFNTGLIL